MRVGTRVSLLALLAVAGCSSITDELLPSRARTAHERYAESLERAGLMGTALGRDWSAAARGALDRPVHIAPPFREAGYFAPFEARAAGYRVDVRDGQRLVVELQREGAPFTLFADIFRATGDSADPFALVASADSTERRLAVDAGRAATYVVRLQPELLRSGRYVVTIRTEPTLAFPVAGRDRRAIQSFFGADRDGGRRSHHGIDIFAPRGTPVIAATDGFVSSTRPNTLGGKVVWLRDGARRQSLYYAHLDSQVVSGGDVVHTGDTLGFVGNTGNARGTAPHLHFGIYRRGEGPVDPYLFVAAPRGARPLPRLTADTGALGALRRTTAGSVRVSRAPDDTLAPLATLAAATPVRVDGAAGSWFRVRLPTGATGYVAARLTEGAESAVRRTTVPAGTPILDRPAPNALIVATTTAPADLSVLGRYDRFWLVETDDGREGWIVDG